MANKINSITAILMTMSLGCNPEKTSVVVGIDTSEEAEDTNVQDTADTNDTNDTNIDTDTPDETGDTDTEQVDSGTETGDTDTGDPPEIFISCATGTQFLSPLDYEFISAGNSLTSSVQVDPLSSYSGYSIRWEDKNGQMITQTAVDGNGQAQYSGNDYTQQRGTNRIFARLITPNGSCDSTIEKPVSVCQAHLSENFTAQPSDWTMVGSAYWDAGGWIEMTGNVQSQKGAVYNNTDTVSSGNISLRFTLKTGNGMNGGADGFAFTIIDIPNPQNLETWLNQAASGGGMGYGAAPPYGNWSGNALTVEIDTWQNDGSSNQHLDPTSSSHIAITRDADPGNHVVWFDTPTVEDFLPHDLRVDIFDGNVRVFYDGLEVINQPVSLSFNGGQMFFSGSTGWASNYHIFDNLEIYHSCQ